MPQPDGSPTVGEKIATALDRSPRIVNDWRAGARWFSNQCGFAVFAIQGTWASLDSDMRATLPRNFVFYLTMFFAALGIISRFIKQRSPGKDNGPS